MCWFVFSTQTLGWGCWVILLVIWTHSGLFSVTQLGGCGCLAVWLRLCKQDECGLPSQRQSVHRWGICEVPALPTHLLQHLVYHFISFPTMQSPIIALGLPMCVAVCVCDSDCGFSGMRENLAVAPVLVQYDKSAAYYICSFAAVCLLVCTVTHFPVCQLILINCSWQWVICLFVVVFLLFSRFSREDIGSC